MSNPTTVIYGAIVMPEDIRNYNEFDAARVYCSVSIKYIPESYDDENNTTRGHWIVLGGHSTDYNENEGWLETLEQAGKFTHTKFPTFEEALQTAKDNIDTVTWNGKTWAEIARGMRVQ